MDGGEEREVGWLCPGPVCERPFVRDRAERCADWEIVPADGEAQSSVCVFEAGDLDAAGLEGRPVEGFA